MPKKMALALVLFCVALNAAGFAYHLFEPVPLYDEVAHFVTPFVLVALLAEVIYRLGGDDEFFPNRARSALTGAGIGFLGAVGWEIVEAILKSLGFEISNALPDSIFDVFLGVVGGTLGALFADRYLDRLFGRSRTNPHRARVR